MVVLVFIVCQVPATVNQVLWNIVEDESRGCGGFHFYLRHIANALVILNSSVNFVIYTAFNTRFRRVLLAEVFPRRLRVCLRNLGQSGSGSGGGATTGIGFSDGGTITATVNRANRAPATPASPHAKLPAPANVDTPLSIDTPTDSSIPANNTEDGVKDTLL